MDDAVCIPCAGCGRMMTDHCLNSCPKNSIATKVMLPETCQDLVFLAYRDGV